jgi:prefoldin subunit 5
VIRQKIERYTHFISTRLQPDLYQVTERINRYNTLLQSWTELKHTLEMMQIAVEESASNAGNDADADHERRSISTMYNIGSDFYMKAKVPAEAVQKHININIGLNYYLEMSLLEALKFIDAKQHTIQAAIDKHRELASKINTNIKTVYAGIGELFELQKEGNKRGSANPRRVNTHKAIAESSATAAEHANHLC